MDDNRDLSHLVDRIVSSDLFRDANYYFRSMKKQPHGGVARIFHPNVYLKYYTADTFRLFTHEPYNIPYFLTALVEEAYHEYLMSEVDIEELCCLCFDDDNFWYVGFRLLKPKQEFEEINKTAPLIWSVISSKLRFQDYFELDNKLLIYALVCYLIKSKMIEIKGIEEIRSYEVLRNPHNKYGLSLVNDAKFLRQGFILDNRYYLYNIFFDTTIGAAIDDVPYTIKIINTEISKADLYFRCDEKVAVPVDKMISTATMDFQKYRGITVDFGDIEKLINKKEIIVHYDPKFLDKVVMIIKPDRDPDGRNFYHIEVEELWNPEKVKDNFVLTNYVHAKYYPDKRIFNHIDFSVNQYPTAIFEEKYRDAVTDTDIPIDKYGDEHYKIWCVESETIEISTWSKLVYATLDEPFRELFIEMFY
ncbi:hypothetical protein [Heyndrickxia oleronia]|uniref:hypothetical protein n=1 Tax=Heyndrickxia oleronia TaxID=38875 RepID=UPI003753DF80